MKQPQDSQMTSAAEATATVEQGRIASHPENLTRSWPQWDHDITLDHAREMIARRRRAVQVNGGAFEKDVLLRLLDQPGCTGARIYYGMHEDGQPALVIAGVDAHGEELVNGVLLEYTYPCPPFCPIGPSLRHA